MSLIAELTAKGGPIMWPLYLAALVCLFFVIERIWALAAFSRREKAFLRDFEEKGPDAVKEHADIFLPAKIMAMRGADEMILTEMEIALERELGRFLTGLSVIYKASPLLGLLGTVLGMIKVFREMAGAGVAQTQYFAGGISEALITTATGLVIAIPALVMTFYLNSRLNKKTSQYEALYLSCREG